MHGPSEPVVRVLRSPGCASWRRALEETQAAMRAVGLRGEPSVIVVRGYPDAVRTGFLGSPTVTVNGRDIEPDVTAKPGLTFG